MPPFLFDHAWYPQLKTCSGGQMISWPGLKEAKGLQSHCLQMKSWQMWMDIGYLDHKTLGQFIIRWCIHTCMILVKQNKEGWSPELWVLKLVQHLVFRFVRYFGERNYALVWQGEWLNERMSVREKLYCNKHNEFVLLVEPCNWLTDTTQWVRCRIQRLE